MALFNKLFWTRKKADKELAIDEDVNGHAFKLAEEQVRVLLFRECEWRGRKLLYDSAAVERVPVASTTPATAHTPSTTTTRSFKNFCQKQKEGKREDKPPSRKANIVQISDGYGFHCKTPGADANLLGEMIFGSVAMNYKGMSLKVHILNAPQRLMCTKIFCMPRRSPCPPRSSISSSSATTTSYDSSEERLSGNWSTGKDDSGFYGDYSSHSSMGSYCNYDSICSLWDQDDGIESDELYCFGSPWEGKAGEGGASMQWRLARHRATSLHRPLTASSQIGSGSVATTNSESLTGSNGSSIHTRKARMGLAIIITLTETMESQMLRFLMEHAMLLEGALGRLRLAVRAACLSPHVFLATMTCATRHAAHWLIDLLTGPRLGKPLWLGLNETRNSGDKTAELFLQDFCSLLRTMDTKDTYFFVSTLITNVLTNHLGWVSSVSPYSAGGRGVEALSRSRPYNPLWAQAGELRGATGRPARLASTVVTAARDAALVARLLTVLSYFIRCTNVRRYCLRSRPVPWDSIDSWMRGCDPHPSTPIPPSENFELGDCIEMRTFSTVRDRISQGSAEEESPTMHISVQNGNRLPTSRSMVHDVTNLTRSVVSVPSRDCSNETLHLSQVRLNSTSTLTNDAHQGKNYYRDYMDCDRIARTLIPTEKVSASDDHSKEIHTGFGKLGRIPTRTALFNLRNGEDSPPQFSTETAPPSLPEEFGNNSVSDLEGVELRKPLNEIHSSLNFMVDSNAENQSAPTEVKKNTGSGDSGGGVLFVLGEDEALVGLKPRKEVVSAIIPEVDSLSCCTQLPRCTHSKYKKHSGVKFEFEKYPQIVTNYMKSKNLELLDRHVIGKPGNLKLDGLEFAPDAVVVEDCPRCLGCSLSCSLGGQALQTPSNASELEYTSDMPGRCDIEYGKARLIVPPIVESADEPSTKNFVRKKLENTLIVNNDTDKIPVCLKSGDFDVKIHSNEENDAEDLPFKKMELLELPMPIVEVSDEPPGVPAPGYSLLGGVTDHYVPDLVLQGTVSTSRDWEGAVRRDLALQARLAPGGAACLLADTDDWSVQVWGSEGTAACGMSALVAGMLDALPHMWSARVPAVHCLAFLECKLRELCVRSKALAELLMGHDLCDMDYLTRTLDLDANDVPLLLAIATTHSPQIALKYGVSFR